MSGLFDALSNLEQKAASEFKTVEGEIVTDVDKARGLVTGAEAQASGAYQTAQGVLSSIGISTPNLAPVFGGSPAPNNSASIQDLTTWLYHLQALAKQVSTAPAVHAAFTQINPNASESALVSAWAKMQSKALADLRNATDDATQSRAMDGYHNAVVYAQKIETKFTRALQAPAASGAPVASDFARALVPTSLGQVEQGAADFTGVVKNAAKAVGGAAGGVGNSFLSGALASNPLVLIVALGAGVFLLSPYFSAAKSGYRRLRGSR